MLVAEICWRTSNQIPTYSYFKKTFEIEELKKQIEKMKCCNNCKHRYFMDFKSVCAFDKSDIKDIENPMTCKCNKWEIEG